MDACVQQLMGSHVATRWRLRRPSSLPTSDYEVFAHEAEPGTKHLQEC